MLKPNNVYRTMAGSTVSIGDSINDFATIIILFDWLKEPQACVDCTNHHINNNLLIWMCKKCGGGNSSLYLDELLKFYI